MTIAVDIGGTWTRIARIDSDLPPSPETTIRFSTPPDLGDVSALLIEHITALGWVDAIGVGCAGLIDPSDGRIRWMPHAEGRDVPLQATLADRFGVPVVVDNDANLAALAEARLGAGVGFRTVLVVTLGTGIGAGLVIGETIERGRGGLGEVGHMRLAAEPGCACGSAGCWETLVSGRVLDAEARAIIGADASGADLVEAAMAGNRWARDALDRAGEWFGVGLGNLVVAVDPDVIVVGGGAAAAGDALLRPASRYLGSRGGGLAVVGIPPILRAAFGPMAGLVGAALAAREVKK
jgi:glucokinase